VKTEKAVRTAGTAVSLLLPLLLSGLLAGCCGSTDGCASPRLSTGIQGRLFKGSGGCGAIPPGGDCPTPVRFDLYPGGRVLIYTEDGERRLAEVTANHEARFTVALSPGTYLVMPDNGMRNGDLVTVPPTGYAETDVQDYIPPP
jgi:hypothetical protein